MKSQSNRDQSVKKEIEQALTSNAIQFEEIPDDNASPLNQPVVEKEPLSKHANDVSAPDESDGNKDQVSDNSAGQEEELDVPEQEISQAPFPESQMEEEVEIPIAHAQIAADTFLGMTDNFLEVGGGFFVRIRKHEDFYDFDEVVQVIDEQNEKNIKKLKLDDEDKALLRPLLIIIIRKRAKRLTPEQQLAGAVISILIKKVKLAAEIRAENNLLVERIRDIIKEETHGQNKRDEAAPDNKSESPKPNVNPELSSVLEVAE